LLGCNYNSTVSFCYATGSVTGDGSGVGNLVGYNNSTITNCYYNSETAIQSSGIGTDSYNQTVTGLSIGQMKYSSNFTDWDFANTPIWEITDGTSFPRLVDVDDAPIILNTLGLIAKVDEEYKDTIQLITMDNGNVSLEMLTYPDGMATSNDSILSWTPTASGDYELEIKATDEAGLFNIYTCTITVLPFDGSGTESDPYKIASLDDLIFISENDCWWDACFIQTANIDASATKTLNEGSGFSPIGNETTKFTGSYNGAGYTIDSLSINRASSYYVGLFGYTYGADIDSLGLTNVDIQGYFYVGGLIGYSHNSTVSACYTICSVSGNGYYIGGLIGFNTSRSTVSYCYSGGSVSGSGSYKGGLIGYNTFNSTVSSCYSTGSVSGIGAYIGGLVGCNYSNAIVSFCYSIGSVSGVGDNVGDLVGYNNSTVTNCYYNSETATQSSGIGTDDNSQAVTGLSISQMKQRSNFTDWDFANTPIWEITDGTSFPCLVDVVDAPVVLHSIGLSAKVNEEYKDTLQVITMDNEMVSLEILTYPEGMKIVSYSILSWTPTAIESYALEIKATDDAGFTNTYTCTIKASSFDGSGTESDPYQITSLDDLIVLSENDCLWGASFIQTTNIDASVTDTLNESSGFSPIGNYSTNFTGNYNGQGYTIDSLSINRPSTKYVGLFGYIEGATIDSLGVTNVDIQGVSYVAGLIGANDYNSTVSSCYSTGSVSGSGDYVGGLIGFYSEESVVNYSYSACFVSGSGDYVGGLLGYNTGKSTVSSCYATGSVMGSGDYVGGLVGYNTAKSIVSYCYATGSVIGDGDNVGDLVGYNYSNSTVSNCYYNSETCLLDAGIGTDDNSQTVTGLTISQMKHSSNFTDWDFANSPIWEITDGTSFPRLVDVDDVPVILHTLGLSAIVNEEYKDTIQVITMDNEIVSLDLLTYPDGMTASKDGILSWTPTVIDVSTLEVKATDNAGLSNTYSCAIMASQFYGSGTESDPYKITSLDDLIVLSENTSWWDAYFIQTNNIDASATDTLNEGSGFSPIGNYSTKFTGSYNGAGYTIDSLSINRSSTGYVGLFGVTNEATIVSLGLTNVDIQGLSSVGGLIGYNYYNSTIRSCYSTGSVKGSDKYVGGLIGYNCPGTTVSSCYSTVLVSGSSSSVGGLIGCNKKSIVSFCYATGSVTGIGSSVGGLVGYNSENSTVSFCYAIGSVTGGGDNVGDLVGYNNSTVSNCYYNSETATKCSGIGTDENSQTVTGLTINQMKHSSNFTDWDFAITPIWEITEGTSFPRLVDVDDVPIVLHTFGLSAKVDAEYKDTIQVVNMDNEIVSLELLNYPDGMMTSKDSILSWTPTAIDGYALKIKVTDDAGLSNTYACTIMVTLFDGSGTESDPYKITSLDDLIVLSENTSWWNAYFIQTTNIEASATDTLNGGSGFSPIGNDSIKFTGNYNGAGYTIDSLSINRSSTSYIGLFGYTKGATIDSLGVTNVDMKGLYDTGGLIGLNNSSTVRVCYSTGYVSGTASYSGGLIGYNYYNSTVSFCYSTGNVSGSSFVGGLIGYNGSSSIVSFCYATGSVVGGGYNTGGLIGYNTSSVSSCYATGSVTVAGSNVGDLVGYNKSTVSNCYYNSETCLLGIGIGTDDYNNQTVTGLSISQMKQSANFSSWDFDSTWGIVADHTYPALKGVSNNAPFAFDDTLGVASSSSLLTNDYDYETAQAALTCKLISTSTKGSINNGAYSFNANTTTGTQDTITYCVGELLASGDTLWGNYATAILTKVDNTAPVLTSVNDTTTDEDTSVTLSLDEVTVSDVDGDVLSLVIVAGDNYFVNGTSITPDANFNDTLFVAVYVSDGELNSDTLSLRIAVTAVNDAPDLISVNDTTIDEDTSFTLSLNDVTASDVDGDSLSLVVVAGAHYTFDETTVTSDADYFGTLAVNITVFDGELYSDTLEMTVTINPVNDAPVLSGFANNYSVEEDSSIDIDISDVIASDVEDDTLTLFVLSGENYTVNGTTITPDSGFLGLLAVSVAVSDGELMSNTMNMTIIVGQTVSIQAIEQSITTITVYPNPATTTLNVTGSTGIAYLYNLTGIMVLSQDLSQGTSINIAALSKGLYMLSVDNETIKVIKQ
jgi:hypothetical protein